MASKKKETSKKVAPKKSTKKNKQSAEMDSFKKTYLKYNKFTADRNAKFKKLPKNRRVVELCKDAVYNILSGIIRPTSGEYVNDFNINPDIDFVKNRKDTTRDLIVTDFLCSVNPNVDKQKQEYIKANNISDTTDSFDIYDAEDLIDKQQIQTMLPLVSCEACAKGGLMVSAVSFKNNIIMGDIGILDSGSLPDLLKDDFTKEEWAMIEICFEKWDYASHANEAGDPKFADLPIENYYKIAPNLDTVNYGMAYAFKHMNTTFLSVYEDGFDIDDEAIYSSYLFQIYCAIIANKGDIFKALDIKNNKTIDYKKIISDIVADYPLFKTKTEMNKMIKPIIKLIRNKPLTYKQIVSNIKEEINENYD